MHKKILRSEKNDEMRIRNVSVPEILDKISRCPTVDTKINKIRKKSEFLEENEVQIHM